MSDTAYWRPHDPETGFPLKCSASGHFLEAIREVFGTRDEGDVLLHQAHLATLNVMALAWSGKGRNPYREVLALLKMHTGIVVFKDR